MTVSKEAVYLRNLVAGMSFKGIVGNPTFIYCDNQSAQRLVKNPVYHERSKYINIHFQYVRKVCKKSLITLKYLPTEEMTPGILTTNLLKLKHVK